MAPRLPAEIHRKITLLLEDDPKINPKHLAEQFSTTLSSVYRIRRGILTRRAIGVDLRKKPGNQAVITRAIEKFVVQLCQSDSSLYQDEIADYIDMEFSLKLDQPQISRLLARLKLTRGKLYVIAAQRDEDLMKDWKLKSMLWHADQLVFLDESSYNNKLGIRKWGYAPSGCRAEMRRYLQSDRTSHSFLPAYTTKGYLKPMCFDGGSTCELFEDWLEKDLLPAMKPAPGIWEILIMDNASCHRNQRVEELCTSFGIQLEYLPPYCPIFNPLEASFHDLKAYIRRHYRIGEDGEYPDFQEFFRRAVFAMASGPEAEKRAEGHFRHAGYSFYRLEENV